MFIGREKELRQLQALYDSGGFQLPVLYGRRRVGKTWLINHFTRGKDTIYFTGIESNAQQNLENLSASIFSHVSGMQPAPVFPSFQTALEYIFALASSKRLIFVMDEYPYAAKAEPSLSSVLQSLIDRYREDSKLFLILCGSSMSFMEEQVLGYQSPLYGRRTAQFKILPFDFFDTSRYFNQFSRLDLAMVYGLVGGTPQYLAQLDEGLSLEDNIKNKLLSPSAYLFEEPGNLLKQEVREAALYNAVVVAIAGGATKLSEIAGKAAIPSSACASYLKNLIALGIVRRETPLTEKEGRKSIYIIADNLFRFWYRFVPENLSLLQSGMVDLAYSRIAPQLTTYMGPVFEEIARQYLWRLNQQGQATIPFVELGRWWGNDPHKKQQVEIDLMGYADDSHALFGECKWTESPVDAGVLEGLVEKSRLFPHTNKHYYLFAKSGFTQGCRDKATALGHVSLISYPDMLPQDHRPLMEDAP